MSAARFQRTINLESGLLGVSGTTSDMQDLLAREARDARAEDARISTPASRVTVRVIPTDEQLTIARSIVRVLGLGGLGAPQNSRRRAARCTERSRLRAHSGGRMRTSVIEVPDMLAVLTVDDVERRFGDVPGVASATVNFAAGQVTVRYDETLLKPSDIRVIAHRRDEGSTEDSGRADGDASATIKDPAAPVASGAKPAAPAAAGAKPATPSAPTSAPTSPPPGAEAHAGKHAAMPGAAAPADHAGGKAMTDGPSAPPDK